MLSFNADLDNVNQMLNPWDNVILNLLLNKVSSTCSVLRVLARGDDGAPGQKAAMMSREIANFMVLLTLRSLLLEAEDCSLLNSAPMDSFKYVGGWS